MYNFASYKLAIKFVVLLYVYKQMTLHMKRLLLPILLTGILCVGCKSDQNTATDWLRFGLKGDVASFTDRYYDVVQTADGQFVGSTFVQGERENKIVYPMRKITFNEYGLWTSIINADSTGTVMRHYDYTYDGLKLIDEKGFENDQMVFHNTYEYDKDKTRILRTVYDNIQIGKRWVYEDQYLGDKRTYRIRTNPDGNMDKLTVVYLDNGHYKFINEAKYKGSTEEPIFFYNKEDKVTRIDFPNETHSYEYDTKGRLYRSYKNNELEMEYIYDKEDRIVRLYGFHPYPFMKGSHRTYRYTFDNFDKHGNWLKCYEYFNDETVPRMILLREIEYY